MICPKCGWKRQWSGVTREKFNPNKLCRKCEFKLDPKNIDSTFKSGFNECWSEICSLKENEATILDIWDFRKADALIQQGIYKINQLTQEDVDPQHL